MLQSLRNKNYKEKSSRKSTLHKFHIKIYFESFVFIDHLYYLLEIIYRSIFYNPNMKLNYWFISKTSNIWGRIEESY